MYVPSHPLSITACAQFAFSSPPLSHFTFSFAATTTSSRHSLDHCSNIPILLTKPNGNAAFSSSTTDSFTPDTKWRLRSILSGIGLGGCCFVTVIPRGSAALIAQGVDSSPVAYGAFFVAAFFGDVHCVLFAASADSDYNSSAAFPDSAQDTTTNYEQLTLINVSALLTIALFAGVRALRRAFRAFYEICEAPLLEELCMSTCCCWCAMAQMSTHVKPQVSSVDMLPAFLVTGAMV